MKIRTKYWSATGATLGTLGLLAALAAWTQVRVALAEQMRANSSEIVQQYAGLRLLTFEYLLDRTERARAQWDAVSRRLDDLLAHSHGPAPEQQAVLDGLRERRSRAKALFAEFVTLGRDGGAGSLGEPARRRLESQLMHRLVLDQQASMDDAFGLVRLAAERGGAAQQLAARTTYTGLALIALIALVGGWLMHRDVLAPALRLQRAARKVSVGDLDTRIAVAGDDELAELARDFDAMTASLKSAFAQIAHSNDGLKALNEELQAFSYSVSHDLRAPLRSMDGFSLVLLEDYGDQLDAEGQDALQRIRAASQRMGVLIDNLLALSQVTRSALRVASVDLGAMAREIVAQIAQEESGATPQWQIDDGLVVQADRSLMQLALKNLLHNAYKFSARAAAPVVRVGALERNGRKVLFVSDNGAGFDMAYAKQLFGAFQRLHQESEFPGTGIGLAIVQRVIQRHCGRVWADAVPGQGATFFFTLGHVAGGNDG